MCQRLCEMRERAVASLSRMTGSANVLVACVFLRSPWVAALHMTRTPLHPQHIEFSMLVWLSDALGAPYQTKTLALRLTTRSVFVAIQDSDSNAHKTTLE